jgi:excisionase family DNA binding protein
MPHTDRLADTIPEACHRLSVSRSALYREISSGKMRAVKVRGRTLITRADQVDWLDSLPTLAKCA